MDSGDLWKLILIVICMGLSAFFSGSETAFIALQRVRLLHLQRTGKPGASRVLKLVQRPEKLLATVLLSNNLVNTAAAALATALAISLVDNTNIAVLIATAATTILVLIIGEIIPKTVAWRRAETVSFAVARPLTILGTALWPVTQLLQLISNSFNKALGITDVRQHLTEEEIRSVIAAGALAGAVEPTEAAMMEKVLRLGDRQVREIMTPRTEIVWIGKNTTLKDFLDIYARETHTRFPVFEDDLENVVGVLSVKDILQNMADKTIQLDSPITGMLRPAYFVPETKVAGQLFSELRQERMQMAMIVDQHGGVAGLVTLKQLTEVIVGPIGEEGEPAQEEFATIGENIYEVDAGIAISEANEDLGLEIPEGDYQTLAGFVLERLGHIPREGEVLYYRDMRLEVTKMRRLKIEQVRVTKVGGVV